MLFFDLFIEVIKGPSGVLVRNDRFQSDLRKPRLADPQKEVVDLTAGKSLHHQDFFRDLSDLSDLADLADLTIPAIFVVPVFRRFFLCICRSRPEGLISPDPCQISYGFSQFVFSDVADP